MERLASRVVLQWAKYGQMCRQKWLAVPNENIEAGLLKALSATLAETSTKPESLCQVAVEGGISMTFGGTEDPTAYAEYICIGVIGGKYNEDVSAKFATILEEQLNIPRDRFYIKFVDPKAADMGLRGSTCAAVFGI